MGAADQSGRRRRPISRPDPRRPRRATKIVKLNDEEQAMRSGEFGPLRRWAIEHQIKVGTYLGAADFAPVTQAHIMPDTESLGPAGVEWLGRWTQPPQRQPQLRIR